MKSRWTAPFRLARALWHVVVYYWQGKPVLAPAVVVLHREETCKRCRFKDDIFCRKCSCILPAKIRLSSEECPDNRWAAL